MSHSDPLPDPFWRAFHRRQPDVDLVLLPPAHPAEQSTARTAERALDDAAAAATLTRIEHTLHAICAGLAPPVDAAPSARWSYDADPGRIRATAQVVERRADGLQVLLALAGRLDDDGWVLTRPPAKVARLLARRGDLELAASYAEPGGVLLLTLATTPYDVGVDRARTVVRAVRGRAS
ncbi:hypothetical protein [Nocardioides sp. GXZ039]|uniref:hypothetical protein n=1 Tax=Nocardioides sp. GXZ039 TaxID=3136018 RepID=UPI0030F401F3